VASGPVTSTRDGQVIENLDVRGTITVRNNNVTIRNVRVDGGGAAYAISYPDGVSGLVVEDSEIFNFGTASIGGNVDGYTARRLDVHHSGGDGFKAGTGTSIESCWVHFLGTAAGAHADGVQVSDGSRVVIRGNFFDMPVGVAGTNSNAAVFVAPDFGAIDDVLVEGNWMDGGNYTVFSAAKTGHAWSAWATNLVVRDNLIGRDYNYGPVSVGGPSTTWTNNRWWDTLAVINA
jgi:hypothetical protein